jgi:formate/nitrite transporter FocA (FNT family)
MDKLPKKFLLYIIRWQLSTPVLAYVIERFAHLGFWGSSALANLIGALIFFWVDLAIFNWENLKRRLMTWLQKSV